DAARHNHSEVIEVRVHVERKPVTRDPPRDPYTDRRDFFVTYPYSSQSLDPLSRNAVVGNRSDQHFLEVAYVAVYVAAVGFEVHDWIPDQLTRPVISHVAASAGFKDLNVTRLELRGIRKDVSRVRAAAQGENARVFQEN